MSLFQDLRRNYKRNQKIECCFTCRLSDGEVVHEIYRRLQCSLSFTEVGGMRHYTLVCPMGHCDEWKPMGDERREP
jgi:hypothetical protein